MFSSFKRSDKHALPEGLFQAAVVLVYAALLAFIIPHHEPWRDETTPWTDLRGLGLGEFFTTYLRHEGHPALWQLILMPFERAGLSFDAIYVIHGLIAVAMVTVFVRFAPFSQLTRALWAFSMPVAFEYSVLARDYSLTTLLLFTTAVLYPRRFEKPWAYAAAVFLLTQTHALMFVTAGALILCYGIELWRRGKPMRRNQVAAWLFMGLGAVATVGELAPIGRYLHGNVVNTIQGAPHGNLLQFLSNIGNAWLPGLADILHEEWAARHQGIVALLYYASFYAPLLMLIWLFSDREAGIRPRVVFLLSCLWFVYIEMSEFTIGLRHYTLLTQIALFALWIARTGRAGENPPTTPPTRAMTLVNLCLFYACVLTPFYYNWDYREPFSASRDVAAFIRGHHLEDSTIVIDDLFPLSALLDSKTCIWPGYLQDCQHTYLPYDAKEFQSFFFKEMRDDKLISVKRAAARFGDLRGKVFVLTHLLSTADMRKYGLAMVYFQNGVYVEHAFVYVPVKDLGKLTPERGTR